MEDVEIALSLLEIIAILMPLSLLAVGLVFRVLKSPNIRVSIGVGKLSRLGGLMGLMLACLASSSLILGIYISMFINSALIIGAITFLLAAIGILEGIGFSFISTFDELS